MVIRRLFAVSLAVMLFLTAAAPGFAVAADAAAEPEVVTPGEGNTGGVPTEPLPSPPPTEGITPPEGGDGSVTEGGEPPLTIAPPAAEFYIELMSGGNGYKIVGYLPDYQKDMCAIKSYYSIDGVDYRLIDEEAWAVDSEATEGTLVRNTVADQNQSPLKEYLKKEIDSFYIRLEYEADGGVFTSQTAYFERPIQVIPLPREMELICLYPGTLRRGYNLTLPEGATTEEVRALLPGSLPIELQIIRSSSDLILARAESVVEWALPEEITPELRRVENAVSGVCLPEGFRIETFYEIYEIERDVTPIAPLPLCLNWVGADAKAEISIYQTEDGTGNYQASPLMLDFALKPTGAERIVPAYSLDGGETWVETDDLLTYNAGVDAVPKNADYRYVTLFTPEQSPYREYLNGEIDGFLLRVNVTGGTLHGISEAAKWPMDYVPPVRDGGDEGSGGNENNTGSGGGGGSNSNENGGQRPTLPPEVPIPVEEPDEPEASEPVPIPSPTPEPPAPPAQPGPEVPAVPEATPAATLAPDIKAPARRPEETPAAPPPEREPPPEIPPVSKEDVPASRQTPPPTRSEGTEDKAVVLTHREPLPPAEAEPPRAAMSMAAVPVAAVCVLLLGGGAIAFGTVGGRSAAAAGGRRLFSAIRRILTRTFK